MNYRSKVALVRDNGLFVELALKLAESFGKVYYCRPWQSAFPSTDDFAIGKVPGLVYTDDPMRHVGEVDLWVYPDIYFAGEQIHLKALGERVWGSFDGEQLETLRVKSKKAVADAGLPVGPYTVLKGISALEDHLRHHGGVFIKGDSKTRGDFESQYSRDWGQIEEWVIELSAKLGKARESKVFVVEEEIPDAVEVAYDGFTVAGQYPGVVPQGIEVKSKGCVDHMVPYAKLIAPLREINEKMAPLYRGFGIRNMVPVEARITKDLKPWVIDPCMRFPSPPTEMLLELVTNWDEILWEGGEGKCADMKPAAEWGAEIMIHTSPGVKTWVPVKIPDELRRWVKLRNFCKIGSTYYIVPQAGGHTGVGACVGLGKTMEEAINRAKKVAEKIHDLGYECQAVPSSLDEAQSEIEKLKKFGLTL